MRLLPALCGVLGALALAGCSSLDRVNRPLPETFAVKGLDGRRLERADFVGRPWLLSLWVPG